MSLYKCLALLSIFFIKQRLFVLLSCVACCVSFESVSALDCCGSWEREYKKFWPFFFEIDVQVEIFSKTKSKSGKSMKVESS
jgi:hypothetical protein